jgi:hypothetical protein
VVRAPGTSVVALTTGTLERTIFPPQRMDIGIAGVGMEELVEMGEHRHSWEFPMRMTLERRGRFSSLSHFDPTANRDKLSDFVYLSADLSRPYRFTVTPQICTRGLIPQWTPRPGPVGCGCWFGGLT